MARPPRMAMARRPLAVPLVFLWATRPLARCAEVDALLLAMDHRRCGAKPVEPGFPTPIIANDRLRAPAHPAGLVAERGARLACLPTRGGGEDDGAQARALLASAEGARRRVRRPDRLRCRRALYHHRGRASRDP